MTVPPRPTYPGVQDMLHHAAIIQRSSTGPVRMGECNKIHQSSITSTCPHTQVTSGYTYQLAQYTIEYGILQFPHTEVHRTRTSIQHPYETLGILHPYIQCQFLEDKLYIVYRPTLHVHGGMVILIHITSTPTYAIVCLYFIRRIIPCKNFLNSVCLLVNLTLVRTNDLDYHQPIVQCYGSIF